MRKFVVMFMALGLFLGSYCEKSFAAEFDWQNICIENSKSILIDPKSPQLIYLGTNKGVLMTEDAGKNWRIVLPVSGQNKEVNYLLFKPGDSNSIYAASGNGLYYSHNAGKNWKRIFRGKSYTENKCLTAAISDNKIFLGTEKGLFISSDAGRSWKKPEGKLADSRISAIVYNKNGQGRVYVSCESGLFVSKDNADSWERIFIPNSSEITDEENDDIEELAEDQREEYSYPGAVYVAMDSSGNDCIYLVIPSGIYKSMDKGLNWELVPEYGLWDKNINSLLVASESLIYLAAKKGIFKFDGQRWAELSLGLIADDFRQVSLNRKGELYAATEKGLFKSVISDYSIKESNLSFCYKDEPEIADVQNAAIKYAEVEPEKILRWRKQAARKAFLPRVTAGLDRDSSDLWHWESGSTTKTGDDILIRGKETVGWSVSLSWDLGEIIWNGDQTSIDTRSRLMVQLREDILDEVNKLYFERLRVKMDLDDLPIEAREKRAEKGLRMRELTAMLDGLTGGYFSQHINVNK